ncbi:hypothetical protein TWF788_000673 [Orbilia oligospora]|uniref:Uncharacterized protein n=1 Tax=Orbilia oligospora TaxID=2813651 RepID=A0A7C8PNW1_ORBOL|nr:hypothetical protein TWF788_000673 [Orbilia oligospora]
MHNRNTTIIRCTWESRVDGEAEGETETEDGTGDDREDGDDYDDNDDDFIKKAFLVCLALQALPALPCFCPVIFGPLSRRNKLPSLSFAIWTPRSHSLDIYTGTVPLRLRYPDFARTEIESNRMMRAHLPFMSNHPAQA